MANDKVCKVCNTMKPAKEFRRQKRSLKRVQTCESCLTGDTRKIPLKRKTCSCCQSDLPVEEFRARYRPNGKLQGYRSRCKSCEKSGWKAAGLEGVNKPEVRETVHDKAQSRVTFNAFHWFTINHRVIR